MLHQIFNTPHGKGNTVKLPGDALPGGGGGGGGDALPAPCPPPPHLGLNSELCIVPSYVANDAENSALRFIKVGFHMLEKSWTIIVQDFSNICGNPV